MKLILFGVAGIFAFVTLILWMTTRLQYRIGSRHLKILLFGLVLRRIPLADIKRISKRGPSRPAEYWYNTLQPSHRLLAIQRNSGLRKFVVISPRNRYIFLADLQNAIQRLKPNVPLADIVDSLSDAEESNVGDDVRSL